jgi:hypothetical protein
VTANTNGGCGGTGLQAQYQPTPAVDRSVDLSAGGAGGAGGDAVWTGTLPQSVNDDAWDLGPHVISVVSGTTTVARASFCVVNNGVTAC